MPAGVPFETLFQTYRGMVGISKDLRRCPERVEQALQILFDTTIAPQLKACDFSAPTPSVAGNYIIMMAHSILNEKQFARFYWPHFKAIFDAVHAQNGTMFVFSEAQILRFADFMDEIPKGFQEAAQALDNLRFLFFCKKRGDPGWIAAFVRFKIKSLLRPAAKSAENTSSPADRRSRPARGFCGSSRGRTARAPRASRRRAKGAGRHTAR